MAQFRKGVPLQIAKDLKQKRETFARLQRPGNQIL